MPTLHEHLCPDLPSDQSVRPERNDTQCRGVERVRTRNKTKAKRLKKYMGSYPFDFARSSNSLRSGRTGELARQTQQLWILDQRHDT